MKEALLRKIASVRRKTTNLDMIEICDYAEKRLLEPPLIITPLPNGEVEIMQDIKVVAENMKRFNRPEYIGAMAADNLNENTEVINRIKTSNASA